MFVLSPMLFFVSYQGSFNRGTSFCESTERLQINFISNLRLSA